MVSYKSLSCSIWTPVVIGSQEAASENISRLSNVSDSYANLPWRKRGLTLQLHFSVAGYGRLRLSFHGITEYLRGLVSVYERPIIAGVQLLMVYSMPTDFWNYCLAALGVQILRYHFEVFGPGVQIPRSSWSPWGSSYLRGGSNTSVLL